MRIQYKKDFFPFKKSYDQTSRADVIGIIKDNFIGKYINILPSSRRNAKAFYLHREASKDERIFGKPVGWFWQP